MSTRHGRRRRPAELGKSGRGDECQNSGSLVPISDEQAKALQEALKTLQGVGKFLRETFGTMPEDVVGLLGGDWLRVRRAENLARIVSKAKERLEARGAHPERPRLSILLPLLAAAADEEDDELQDVWASLLAAAADPERAKSFRVDFIDTVKQMDPLDAAVLKKMVLAPDRKGNEDVAEWLARAFQVTRDETYFSLQRLAQLKCLAEDPEGMPFPRVSPKGKLLIRAVEG